MLFTIIRDFFVQYVFGGVRSDGSTFGNTIGRWLDINGRVTNNGGFTNFYVPVNAYDYGGNNNPPIQIIGVPLADWLSTTSTIITLVIILVCIAFFIRWIFKVVSNSILLR